MALDPKELAKKLDALHAHLQDQPLTHADSTDMATLRQASSFLASLAQPDGYDEWPALKRALWHVVMDEELYSGNYIEACPFVEKLYTATLASAGSYCSFCDLHYNATVCPSCRSTTHATKHATKPLVWCGNRVDTSVGVYSIVADSLAESSFELHLVDANGTELVLATGLTRATHARAAAQVDYEKRSLSISSQQSDTDGWRECATDGCCNPATVHFERGGVGSDYCRLCYMAIQALSASLAASQEGGK